MRRIDMGRHHRTILSEGIIAIRGDEIPMIPVVNTVMIDLFIVHPEGQDDEFRRLVSARKNL